MLVSIIVPCCNEEAVLPLFLEEIRKTEAELSAAWGCKFELVFVDDGSKDGTLEILRKASGGGRALVCPSPGISARKRPCTPDSSTAAEITWY